MSFVLILMCVGVGVGFQLTYLNSPSPVGSKKNTGSEFLAFAMEQQLVSYSMTIACEVFPLSIIVFVCSCTTRTSLKKLRERSLSELTGTEDGNGNAARYGAI